MARTLFDQIDPAISSPSVLHPLPFEAPGELTSFVVNVLQSREKVPIDDAVLVIVDVQNDFINPTSGVGSVGKARAVPGVNRLLEAFRARKRPIIHVRTLHVVDGSDLSQVDSQKKSLYCVEGSFGAEFVDEVKPIDGEPVITKRRYDGFVNTDLEMTLRNIGVTTLVVCGISIDCCVQHTAMAATNLGYSVVIPADAVSASDWMSYFQALRHVCKSIGKVALTTNLI